MQVSEEEKIQLKKKLNNVCKKLANDDDNNFNVTEMWKIKKQLMNIDKQETGAILNQDGNVCETKDDIKNAYKNNFKNKGC